jgi:hypothetical protein
VAKGRPEKARLGLGEYEHPGGSVEDARNQYLLRIRVDLPHVLEGPIRFWPIEGERAFRFEGRADLTQMFAGVAGVATKLASPTGFEPVSWP